MAFKPQVHLEPVQTRLDNGSLVEWVKVHTYDASHELALLDVHGLSYDSDTSVSLWLFEEQVRTLRDALTEALGE